MGRGRRKGKKQTMIASNDDVEEEKLPSSNKRRGRPQKPLKEQVEDDQKSEKMEDDENPKSKESTQVAFGKARKRKKPTKEENSDDAIDEENEDSWGAKYNSDSNGSFVKSVGGFRPNGSRRKSKPCRAAEVGVW